MNDKHTLSTKREAARLKRVYRQRLRKLLGRERTIREGYRRIYHDMDLMVSLLIKCGFGSKILIRKDLE